MNKQPESMLTDLTSYLSQANYKGTGKWIDDFSADAISDVTFSNRVYMIPHAVYTDAFFYSKKLFREHGRVPPKTWDEFLDLCQYFKTNTQIAPLTINGASVSYLAWYPIWLSIRIEGAEKFFDTMAKKPGTTWRDPGFIRAANMVQDLRDKGYFVKGYDSGSFAELQGSWVQGKSAMYYCGSWLPSEVSDVLPSDFDIGAFPFPSVAGGKGDPNVAALWCNAWAIPADSKNKEQAIKYLKYMTTTESANVYTALGSASPVRSATNPKGFEDLKAIFNASKGKTIRQRDGMLLYFRNWGNDVYHPLCKELFLKISGEDFINRLEEASKSYTK